MFKDNSSFNVLYTSNIAKTYDFYKAIGGIIEKLEEDKVVVKFGSFELHYILDSTEPFEEYKYITIPDNYGQGVIFYIETDNIDQMPNLITKAGGALKSDIFDNKWGCKELLFEDVNGYKFALYQ